MKPIHTSINHYYSHRTFVFLFAALFTGLSVAGLISPESITVKYNNQVVETNLAHLLPFLVIGLGFWVAFIWISFKYFRVTISEESITVQKMNGGLEINWTDIETIQTVGLMKGVVFKLKPKGRSTLYFLTDRPQLGLKELFSGKPKTRMGKLIERKKQELGI